MGKIGIIIVCLFLSACAISQENDTTQFTEPKQESKWKFLIGFDAQRSFFSGRPVKINGLRIGAKYKRVHRFGLGFYGLRRNVVFKDINVEQPDATDTSYVSFNAGYAAFFYEYAFFETKRWELNLPLYIGGGSIRPSYTDTAGIYQPLPILPFSMISTGIGVQFKIFRWFGLKGGLGYRLVYNSEEVVKEAFKGPYYKYGIQIFFGELWKMVFKKDELEDW